MYTLGILGNLQWYEVLIILTLALLLFGRRLPEVGRSLGKGIVEFKKGIKGIEDEVNRPEEPASSSPRANVQPAYRAPLESTGGPAGSTGARIESPAGASQPPNAG